MCEQQLANMLANCCQEYQQFGNVFVDYCSVVHTLHQLEIASFSLLREGSFRQEVEGLNGLIDGEEYIIYGRNCTFLENFISFSSS